MAPEPPSAAIIEISEWVDPTLKPVWMEPVDITAGAAQFIDNFLDFAHFPFVHGGTFGNAESPLLHDFTVDKREGGLVVTYEHTITNHEDPLVATGEHPLVQPRIMRYEYTVPFSAVLRLELPTANMLNAIAVFCQPVRRDLTRLYMVMLRNDCPDEASAQAAVDYEMTVLAEDLRVLDHLPSDALALDPTAQIHTRADRLTLEFRRLLRDLVRGAG
jgi:phenylpropionate dioxygenase-like ring-hydroxylating dioxygenase large terminal subunit